MRKFKGVWVTLIIIVMFSYFSMIGLAESTYPQPSGIDYDYQTGTGFFNQLLTDVDIYTKTLNTQKAMPLVNDLDADGINEIIIMDGNVLEVYQGRELTLIDTITTNSSGTGYFITYDIDGDDKIEIITTSSGGNVIEIFGFNGSILTLEQSLPEATSNVNIMLACKGTNDCIVIGTLSGGDSVASKIYAQFFSSSSSGTATLVSTASGYYSQSCFPQIPAIAVADYDGDTDIEYIFSWIDVLGIHEDRMGILWLGMTAEVPVIEQYIRTTDRTWDACSQGSQTCYCAIGNYGRIISSPLVMDIDGSGDDEQETIIGLMKDDDEFKILSYDKDANFLDDYPEVWDADGVLLSNPMRATAFIDEGNNNAFCVMGFEANDQTIDLVCGSELETYSGGETIEFKSYITDYWNISTTYGKWNILTQTAQHSTDLTNGVNLNEIVNSYGVWRLDYDCVWAIEVPIIRCLTNIYENPKGDGVVLSIDAENAIYAGGREDLIVMTTSNLFYIDDKFVNRGAEITEYTVNPCLDATWKLNTTVGVTVKIDDNEGDLISAKVVLYTGHTNEQIDPNYASNDGWSGNLTAGTEIPFWFTANQTIGVGALTLYGRDIINPENIDSLTLTFSVSTEGVEYGDCITETVIEPSWEEVIGEDCETDDDCGTGNFCIDGVCVAGEDTLPQQAMDEASEVFNIPKTALFLMFMMGLAIAFWFAPVSKRADFFDSANARFGAIIIGESFMLILGTYFGWLPVAIIITIVILALVAFSIWVVRQFTGRPTG